MADTYLGVDLGGTKLLIGEMDSGGAIARHKRYSSGGRFDQRRAVELIEASLDAYLAERPREEPLPLALGLGLVGRVDNAGVWFEIDPQRAEELRIAERLSVRYQLPCYIDNDVRAATRAEARFGCGRTSKDFIYINIGTGIAAGLVSGGHVIRGAHHDAGEVGHTLVGLGLAGVDIPCACGRVNCVEAIASGLGLDVCARTLLPRYPDTTLAIPADGARVSAREVFEQSASDPLCALLTETLVKAIASLIMNLVRVSDPDTVVLGGGIVSDGFLYPRILAALHQSAMRFVSNGVVLTRLDPAFSGLLGACTVAMN